MKVVVELDLVALCDRLKELREKSGLSQEKLAVRAGLTVAAVRKVEQGEVKNPRWFTMRTLARALDVSLDDLAAASDETTAESKKPRSRGRPRKRKG